MEETIDRQSVLRILDANLNRLKEGVRVIEDTARYLYDDKAIASKLKSIRHQAILKSPHILLETRCTQSDVLKKTIPSEAARDGIKEIVLANFKRIEESSRVLEEYLKHNECKDFGESEVFKSIRYEIYEIEKEFILKYFSDK